MHTCNKINQQLYMLINKKKSQTIIKNKIKLRDINGSSRYFTS